MDMNHFLTISKDLLNQGTSVRFEARGWSMRPLIRDGDFVIACSVKNCPVKRGDIVFYITNNNRVFVHRVIGWRRNNGERIALIKGDACYGPPEKVPVRDIVGRVVVIERKGRTKRLDTIWHKMVSLIFVAVSPLTIWMVPILIRKTSRLRAR